MKKLLLAAALLLCTFAAVAAPLAYYEHDGYILIVTDEQAVDLTEDGGPNLDCTPDEYVAVDMAFESGDYKVGCWNASESASEAGFDVNITWSDGSTVTYDGGLFTAAGY